MKKALGFIYRDIPVTKQAAKINSLIKKHSNIFNRENIKNYAGAKVTS